MDVAEDPEAAVEEQPVVIGELVELFGLTGREEPAERAPGQGQAEAPAVGY